ncbi:MAG: Transcriptional regulator, TrmB [Candidatus Magasanikbacteria bacterium GW2011_GWA2_56_11]|uniref:Transcriptional regulator, TrmB n=1 Tax=Candidatus Magasanikbacteria bacterium GW2011_GWA2_56_11 TaxID=1619044 RepID=A0A0G1YFX2_9BACT|nr:MAG: Transcriptional regulator, TrmB [Candidatus Magasanikbacteria bacterium GW2011_GWA2_56_11]
MTIDIILQRLGFSKNEIQVYLAALELSVAPAQDIAKEAGLPRTTAYSILAKLVRRGVVGKTLSRGKTRFVAEPPEALLRMVSDMHEELEKAMPELAARYNQKDGKPRIIFYEGKGAIQKVLDDTLESRPDEILEWNTDEFFKRETYSIDRLYIDKRVKLGIRARRIAGAGSGWQAKHQPYDKNELSQTVIVPRGLFWPDIEVNIYNNKVAFINYVENMSLILESKPIADAMRQAYELSWQGAQNAAVE